MNKPIHIASYTIELVPENTAEQELKEYFLSTIVTDRKAFDRSILNLGIDSYFALVADLIDVEDLKKKFPDRHLPSN
ncbi:hypothetical protein [Paenibacillus odorifer]|uniref:hypothetical protein n=1 Tax=Paenibacillus odorifer TaxID=189426 RepID=UPI00096D9E28|nr:hypothetical protein [Paenibacillus odorifer]OMD09842.1 hypothetical protein BJP50_29355 [Paenibacillus odorifer]